LYHLHRCANLLSDLNDLLQQPVLVVLYDSPVIGKRADPKALILGSSAFEKKLSVATEQPKQAIWSRRTIRGVLPKLVGEAFLRKRFFSLWMKCENLFGGAAIRAYVGDES